MQVKVWLLGISPMVWRRLLVSDTCTLRELHGVIQVAMGWEGIHLYQFCLRSRRYGPWQRSWPDPHTSPTRKGADLRACVLNARMCFLAVQTPCGVPFTDHQITVRYPYALA